MRGHIEQRTKGSWTIRVELPRDPKTNKRRQKTVTIPGTKKEAEAKLAQMLVEIGQGYHVDAEDMTVGQYLERWLNTAGRKKRPNTKGTYQRAVKTFSQLIGYIPLQKLTPLDVEDAVNKLEDEGRLGAGTIQLYLVKLRIALKQAVEWDFIRKSPAASVKSVKYERPETDFWTEEEAQVFLEKALKCRYYSLFWLALHSGLREGEIAGLTWEDIDLVNGLVHVRRTATRFGSNPPKSSAGKRTVPIDQETVKVIKKHRKNMIEECLRCGDNWSETLSVFLTTKGKKVSGDLCWQYFTVAVRRISRDTGIKKITFHGLRHTYATALLRREVPPEKVAQILGHVDVATLMNTYAHCLPKDEQTVLRAISQAFHK